MPYIDPRTRIDVARRLDYSAKTPGELNYLLTELVRTYLADNGERCQTYNDILGALEGCKLELYARKVRPYEDSKIVENGDVY